jgi:hypothetical protein
MTIMLIRGVAGVLFFTGAAAAQLSNLSGMWSLNPGKSHWGSMQQPQSVFVEIEHREPALRYCGTVTYLNEEQREFCFDGAIDGKPYVVDRSYGRGTMTARRVDARIVESTYVSDDGRYSETSVTTVSRDGKRLTRRMRLTFPQGSKSWIEEYEKK